MILHYHIFQGFAKYPVQQGVLKKTIIFPIHRLISKNRYKCIPNFYIHYQIFKYVPKISFVLPDISFAFFARILLRVIWILLKLGWGVPGLIWGWRVKFSYYSQIVFISIYDRDFVSQFGSVLSEFDIQIDKKKYVDWFGLDSHNFVIN